MNSQSKAATAVDRRRQASRPGRRVGRRGVLLALLLVVAAVGFRPAAANLADYFAAQRLRAGDLGAAERWADWGRRWGGQRPRQRLIRAAVARRQGLWQKWQQLVDEAQRAGGAEAAVEQERHLGAIAGGKVELLGSRDVPQWEAYDAVVYGSVATGRLDLARDVVAKWTADQPQNPSALYWSARLAELDGDNQRAERLLQKALAVSPRHQLAQLALGRLLERTDRLLEAFRAFASVARLDQVEEAQVATARLLRKQGRVDAAEQALGKLDSPAALAERGELAVEQGEYQQAVAYLQQAGEQADQELLALALHMAGRDEESRQLHEQLELRKQRQHREDERNQAAAAAEQQRDEDGQPRGRRGSAGPGGG